MMRELFLKDWAWKLFSLLLAAAIWLTVHRILEPEAASLVERTSMFTYQNVIVHIVSSSADMSLYHVVPEDVRITVTGPPEVMDQLHADQIRAEVELTGSGPGSGQVNVITPPGVTLMGVDPPTVSVIVPPKH
jgi:YbbR domain-containing protein